MKFVKIDFDAYKMFSDTIDENIVNNRASDTYIGLDDECAEKKKKSLMAWINDRKNAHNGDEEEMEHIDSVLNSSDVYKVYDNDDFIGYYLAVYHHFFNLFAKDETDTINSVDRAFVFADEIDGLTIKQIILMLINRIHAIKYANNVFNTPIRVAFEKKHFRSASKDLNHFYKAAIRDNIVSFDKKLYKANELQIEHFDNKE